MIDGLATATLAHIRRVGFDVLTRELGAVGTARFLQQFAARGHRDYTAERHAQVGQLSVADILVEEQ